MPEPTPPGKERRRDRCLRIVEKLRNAREQFDEGGLRDSFTSTHRFSLSPPLSEENVAELENQLRVQLPEDYRVFLTVAGGSGAGPSYGLYRPESWNSACHYETSEKISGCFSEKCRLQPGLSDGWVEELFRLSGGQPDDAEDFCPYAGVLALGTQGCAYETVLVLNGQFRGRVVNIDGDCQPPKFAPHANFLDWYEGWLDLTLEGKQIGWYGY